MTAAFPAPDGSGAPIVGVSVGVTDPVRLKGGLDGIGIYTEALLAHLPEFGVAPRRVDSRQLGAHNSAVRHTADFWLPLPLPVAISVGAIMHMRTPGCSIIARHVDLYHSTDYMVPRLPGTPVVATVYDAIPVAYPQWANRRLRRLKNWLLTRSVGNADRVIAISEAAREEVISHYHIQPDRTRVIPLGIDDSWFEAVDVSAAMRTLRNGKLEPGYFLFVGTLQPRKNIGMLLDAYERLPVGVRAERQLVIVGKYGWNSIELKKRLDDARLHGRCLWLDHIPREDLRHLYACAGAFVFPSLAEGFGLPVLEALASGLSVIASDLPALREVGGDHVLYVTPGDQASLIDGMVAASKASHDDVAAKQRRTHAARFSWRACAKRTVDVYRELWTSSGATARD